MPKIIKHHQLIILILIILVAIFFRFWQIRDYVVFLGDEGRDMIVMRDIFVNSHLPFLGPSASVGGFYLGPIYYWMAAPFLFLTNFDPVGPSYFVAALGVATVFLLYKFLKEEVGFWPAAISSFLYATAPLIVRYSRSSWNPNPLPFFSLLLIYSLYLAKKRQKDVFFLLAGASLGIAIQLHYLAILLVPIATLICFVNFPFKKVFKITPLSLVGFLITFSPFLIFEIVHNFPNIRTILEFVTRGSTVNLITRNIIWIVTDSANIFFNYIAGVNGSIWVKLVFYLTLIPVIWGSLYLWKSKKLIISIVLIWFFGGLVAIRLYAGQIFDYYYGFMFPAPFVTAAFIIYIFWQNIHTRLFTLVLLAVVLIVFVTHGFYKSPPNNLIDQTSNIADFVLEKSEGQPYNFALISDHNSDHAYRYFLEVKKNQPKQLEEIVTEQLLIVCESKNCEPLGHPLWEIAAFGRGEILGEWNLEKYGIKIFRLTHWPEAPSPAGKPAVKGG